MVNRAKREATFHSTTRFGDRKIFLVTIVENVKLNKRVTKLCLSQTASPGDRFEFGNLGRSGYPLTYREASLGEGDVARR